MSVFEDYTIEGLTKEFCIHADKADKQREKDRANKNIILTPDEFNIARALSVMCAEIERLKHRL